MICLICGRNYYKKRNIATLFKEEASYRCPACNRKYPVVVHYQTFPKQSGLVHIYSLFLENIYFDLTAFNDEIKILTKKILTKKQPQDTFLWVDELSYHFLENLDLLNKDVFITTNTPYIKYKEVKDEI